MEVMLGFLEYLSASIDILIQLPSLMCLHTVLSYDFEYQANSVHTGSQDKIALDTIG